MYMKDKDAFAVCGADECKLEEFGVEIFQKMLDSNVKNKHVYKWMVYNAARNALKMCNVGVEPDRYLDELGDTLFNWIREFLAEETRRDYQD